MSQFSLPFDPETPREEDSRKQAETAPPPSIRRNRSRRAGHDPQAEKLAGIFRRLYGRWAKGEIPPVHIEFYPYTTLRHTLRVRDGAVIARLSDAMRAAPEQVQEAILAVLICKLLRRRPPVQYKGCYEQWAGLPAVRRMARKIRAARGRKQLTSPVGKVFDLRKLFARINRRYFGGELEVRHLSWSRQKARRRLGHYDPAHQAIVINRRLDNPIVPEYVVEFVLYHEMLHASLGERCRNGRNHFHHDEFRAAERRFHDFKRAERFIDREL